MNAGLGGVGKFRQRGQVELPRQPMAAPTEVKRGDAREEAVQKVFQKQLSEGSISDDRSVLLERATDYPLGVRVKKRKGLKRLFDLFMTKVLRRNVPVAKVVGTDKKGNTFSLKIGNNTYREIKHLNKLAKVEKEFLGLEESPAATTLADAVQKRDVAMAKCCEYADLVTRVHKRGDISGIEALSLMRDVRNQVALLAADCFHMAQTDDEDRAVRGEFGRINEELESLASHVEKRVLSRAGKDFLKVSKIFSPKDENEAVQQALAAVGKCEEYANVIVDAYHEGFLSDEEATARIQEASEQIPEILNAYAESELINTESLQVAESFKTILEEALSKLELEE